MRTLLLADIHGNLTALEAILATPEAAACDRVFSLGDHVNYGPRSRAVHRRLKELHAEMVLGNHEERFAHLDGPDFAGYNWALLRWTAEQMAGLSVEAPLDVCRGSILFTHGTPGDPYHLVYPEDMPTVLDALPPTVTLLLSGHNHQTWDVRWGNRRAFNPGSAGLLEEAPGGLASFAVMEETGEEIRLTRHLVAYDVDAEARAYLETGAAWVVPALTRACLQVMRTGEYQGGLKLVRYVHQVAAARGLTLGDEEAWKLADGTYPWPEKLSSEEFWRKQEERLC